MEYWNQIGSWVLVFCLILQPCCVFTFEVKWTYIWDDNLKDEASYLKAEGANLHLQTFSMIVFMVFTFVLGIVLLVFFWKVRRDKKSQAQMKEELSDWRLALVDVFRTPSYPSLLCIMVGNGVQILGLAIVSLVFAALGLISPVSRQTLIMGMLLFSMILSVASGYVAVRLWITMNQKGWTLIALKTNCYFSLSFSMLTFLHFILWGIPNSVSFIGIPTLVCSCISVPLTLVGGYFGAKATFIEIPIETGAHPRNIPDQVDDDTLEVILLVGVVPAGIIWFEFFIVQSVLTTSHVYYGIGLVFVLLIHIVVICAELSLGLTYFFLHREDWAWWWKSFFAPCLFPIYMFVFCTVYPEFGIKSLNDLIFATGIVILWFGYSLLIVLAIMLATGTVGFFSSFWFVHHLYDAYISEKMKSQDAEKVQICHQSVQMLDESISSDV